MTAPRVSVVVPFFNVESFVVPCLESLQRQTESDLEVILVDDGSQDRTSELVADFVARDGRFHVVRQENQGLGPARNTGAAHATGKYMTFVDSDDLVPRRGLARMVASLEESGSDMAAGNARRFDNLGVRQSFVHRLAFQADVPATHISSLPLLGLDRMAWNKMYRRQFFVENALSFPGMLYEDYPVSIQAHLAASTVDVLAGPVYYWRERDGGEPSITQRTWALDNLRDRVVSAEMVMDLLQGGDGLDEVTDVVADLLLRVDLAAVIGAVHQNDERDHVEILALAQRLLTRIPDRVRDRAARFDALQAALIERGRLRELIDLEDYRAAHGVEARIVTRGRLSRKRYVELPFFGEDHLVPRQVYEVPADRTLLRPVVTDAVWRGGVLHVELDVGMAPMRVGDRARVRVFAVARDGRRAELQPERFEKQAYRVGADLSGLRLRIDPLELPEWERPGFWTLQVRVRAPHFRGEAAVATTGANRAKFVPTAWVAPGMVAQLVRRFEGMGVWVRRPAAVVEQALELHDVVELRGTSEQDPGPSARLVLTMVDGHEEAVPVLVEREDPAAEASSRSVRPFRWTARVPVRRLLASDADFDPVEEPEQVLVALDDGVKRRRLVRGSRFAGASVASGWRAVTATSSVLGQLVLLESHTAPRLVDLSWSEPEVLTLRGVWHGPEPLGEELVLRVYPRPLLMVEHRVAVEVQHGLFTARVHVGELVDALAAVPDLPDQRISARPWNLLFGVGVTTVFPVIARDVPGAHPDPHVVRGHDVSLFADRNDVARLLVRRL